MSLPLVLLLAGLLPAARAGPVVPAPDGGGPRAATLFHGGRVQLGDREGSVAEALLVEDGRVVAVGSEAELLARVGDRPLERVDLRGGVALPGLQDAHVRLGEAACPPYTVELAGCADLEAVLQRMLAAAASTPEGEWIEARGLLRSMLPPGELPTHEPLSRALPDHPVVLRSADGEAALLNEAALRRARIVFGRHGFPHVAGGRAPTDESGAPTGLLLGDAVALLAQLQPPRHRVAVAQSLLAAQDRLLARGVTAVHAMGLELAALEELERLRAAGLWKLRVLAWIDGAERLDERLARRFAREREGGERVALVGVHLRVDGAIGWQGEALLEHPAGGSRPGAARVPADVLAERLRTAAALGLSPALEAHGDRGIRVALDLIEGVGLLAPSLRALRPRIEGADLVAPADWERFPELGVVVSIQPLRADQELGRLEPTLGEERARSARIWWALAPRLGNYALGSAWPAAEGDVLDALAAARRAHELVSEALAEERPAGAPPPGAARALAGFTWRAAEAGREEATRGRLAPGYAADLTVLDVDPLACSMEELEQATVLMTVIEGELVYPPRPR